MPIFKEMDPEEVWKLLESQTDALTPLSTKEDSFFRNISCPTCGSKNMQSFINQLRPFTEGSPLPNKLLRCLQCETEFDPYSKLITKVGLSQHVHRQE